MGPVLADDMEIEGYGSVTPPPELFEIVERIATAADAKETIELSPGELRVLVNYLALSLTI